MENLLDVKNLKKYFKTPHGNLHAVDDVSFSIKRGQTLGVVGESGCGKSTLGRMLLRLIEPTAGQILYDGQDIVGFNRRALKQFRKKMQIIFQDPYSSLNPRMTVSELIAEPLRVFCPDLTKNDVNDRVNELMKTIGIAERLVNSYPHELDGGRRQRIGVARALAINPEGIVCDEPVSALDVSIQAQILNLLMDLQEQFKLTYVFITHDLSVVKHISTEISVLYLGQCVEHARSDELFENPLHPYTQALLEAIPLPNLTRKGQPRENIIRGELSSPINPKPGCRFAVRCPYAKNECSGEDIPLKEISPGHYAACCRLN